MEPTNKTLYIPLYGKALVSRMGILLHDISAEEIWRSEHFHLRGKARSKWLAYFMGMRAAVIDQWTAAQLTRFPEATVLHLGCGLDARFLRVEKAFSQWFDVDMPDVISVRHQYFAQTEEYHMLEADVTQGGWLEQIPSAQTAIVVMEGLSMYLPMEQLKLLLGRIQQRFPRVLLILDTYTRFGVKASKYSNPIKTVGAGVVTGVDDPHILELNGKIRFTQQLSMTPEEKISELPREDQSFFRTMFAGKATERIYRLYTYELTR